MNYTQVQIDRANAVSLEDFLRTQGETLIKSGREYRWKEPVSYTHLDVYKRQTSFQSFLAGTRRMTAISLGMSCASREQASLPAVSLSRQRNTFRASLRSERKRSRALPETPPRAR